jgi:hypothetical protein
MKMKKINMKIHVVLLIGIFLFLWQATAEAARRFTVTQTNPLPPAQITMGDTVPITFRITNTSTGGNTGERI